MKGSTKLGIATLVSFVGWYLWMTFRDGWQQEGYWEQGLIAMIIAYLIVDAALFIFNVIMIVEEDQPLFKGPLSSIPSLIIWIKNWADKNL